MYGHFQRHFETDNYNEYRDYDNEDTDDNNEDTDGDNEDSNNQENSYIEMVQSNKRKSIRRSYGPLEHEINGICRKRSKKAKVSTNGVSNNCVYSVNDVMYNLAYSINREFIDKNKAKFMMFGHFVETYSMTEEKCHYLILKNATADTKAKMKSIKEKSENLQFHGIVYFDIDEVCNIFGFLDNDVNAS